MKYITISKEECFMKEDRLVIVDVDGKEIIENGTLEDIKNTEPPTER